VLAISKAGSATALANAAGISAAYLSQIKNKTPESKTRKPKGMGDDVARKIEKALALQIGWMDERHDLQEIATYDGTLANGDIEIRQFHEAGGAMGAGVLLRDQPGEIHSWHVTPEWIAKNVRSHTGAANLCIVTGFGDSMQPLYNPGDPLLVDIGVKSAEHDGIYFFRIGNEGFIKRLQRIPGVGLMAISDNKLYEKWVIGPDMDFEVFAKVVKVWCGSDR